jgi:hypothetical protein
MSATPVIRYTLAGLRKAAPGRSFGVPRCRHPALEAWYRQLHAQILGEKRPVSGRAGRYVYYWAYGRLCWRAYVVPKDPRTAVQRRSRAAFGAASKAWSESRLLTQERRGAWCAAAANTKSPPGPVWSSHRAAELRRTELAETAVGPAAPVGPTAGGNEEGRMQKADAGICRARGIQFGHLPGMRGPCAALTSASQRGHRRIVPFASSAPPASYATLLGPLPYRCRIAAVSLPLGSADTGPPRRPWFASIVVNPGPNPPQRPLSRTLARRIARPQHCIAALRGCFTSSPSILLLGALTPLRRSAVSG